MAHPHDPIAALMHDHELVMKVIDALASTGGMLEEGVSVDSQFFTRAVRFMREFVDDCHHTKEERVLFPALEEKGLPRSAGPLFVMRAEHDEGRRLIRALALAADAYAARKDAAERELAHLIGELTELYAGHITKENEVLFPMAARLFSEDEKQSLFERFEKVEAEAGRDHDSLAALALALEREARS